MANLLLFLIKHIVFMRGTHLPLVSIVSHALWCAIENGWIRMQAIFQWHSIQVQFVLISTVIKLFCITLITFFSPLSRDLIDEGALNIISDVSQDKELFSVG